MSLREKTNRLEVVLTLLLIQLILLPAALGVTYASSGTRPEHNLHHRTAHVGQRHGDGRTGCGAAGAVPLQLRQCERRRRAEGDRPRHGGRNGGAAEKQHRAHGALHRRAL